MSEHEERTTLSTDNVTDVVDGHGRRRAPLIAGAVAAVLAVLIGVMAAARSGPRDIVDRSLVGRVAPAIVGATLDGGQFDLSRRRGSWVFVNFFQTSCVPCVQEHPELRSYVERGGAAELVTVVYFDTAANVRDFFARNGGNWPVVLDDEGRISVAYGVAKVPETWIVDPDGIVRERIGGAVSAARLDATLAALKAARGQ
jgi:cytochrome c biogenesis protein CcmG, thiol:disulfide interchange protein DsbE